MMVAVAVALVVAVAVVRHDYRPLVIVQARRLSLRSLARPPLAFPVMLGSHVEEREAAVLVIL